MRNLVTLLVAGLVLAACGLPAEDHATEAEASTRTALSSDTTKPTVTITSPASGAYVGGRVTLQADATDDTGISRVEFSVNHTYLGTDTTPPFSMDWDTTVGANGSYTLTAVAWDTAGNVTVGTDVPVTVYQPGSAVFDPGLHVPACAALGPVCDTTSLLWGRADGESNAPNTLDGCADGTAHDWSTYAKGNRIKVSRINGELLAEGRLARIEVNVLVGYYSTDYLDLFYASDATQPSWTYLTTLRPTNSNNLAQVLTTSYYLPAGSLQAVRAQYRVYGDSSSACSGGAMDDHDDVVFAVGLPTDTFPPTVSLSAPSNNALVRGVVPMSAWAEDDLAVTRVEFYVDGALIGTDTSAPYNASWDSSTATSGAHTLLAKAYDNSGHVGTSTAVVVNTDTTPPDVVLTSPTQGSLIRGFVTFAATATDFQAIKQVEFWDGPRLIGIATNAPYSVYVNSIYIGEGTRTITAKAVDGFDNVGTSAPVTVTIDNTPPTTSITAPAQNAPVRGTVQLSATASDNLAVAVVEFYAGETLIGWDTTAPYTASWDTTSVANGSVTLTTRAYDTAGNVTPSAALAVSVDNTAPTVALTSPANGATVFLSTTVQATAGDNVGVTQVVFYDGATVIGTDTTAPYSVSWSLLLVSKGTHTLTARASDAAGNMTTSAPISVKVN